MDLAYATVHNIHDQPLAFELKEGHDMPVAGSQTSVVEVTSTLQFRLIAVQSQAILELLSLEARGSPACSLYTTLATT